MKKLNGIVLGLATLLAFSCSKEGKQEDPTPQTQDQNAVARTCQLLEYFDPLKTTYTNDSTGRVIRTYYKPLLTVSTSGISRELLYNAAGNISEIRDYNDNQVLLSFQAYSYNTLGLPDTIKAYVVPGGMQTIYDHYVSFEYNAANQLVKKIQFDLQRNAVKSYSILTYPAPNQSKEQFYAVSNSSSNALTLNTTTLNQYDNKKSPNTLLNFYDLDVLVSKHNIIASSKIYHDTGGSNSHTISYVYNADDFPVSGTMVRPGGGSVFYLNWSYNCQ